MTAVKIADIMLCFSNLFLHTFFLKLFKNVENKRAVNITQKSRGKQQSDKHRSVIPYTNKQHRSRDRKQN